MMPKPRFVYGGLLVLWLLIVAWQLVEHQRVRESARRALIDRARDISNTLGLVLRSQRRFGGVISRERLETVLASLIKEGELNSIALLNDAGEPLAAAGAPLEINARDATASGPRWTDRTVILPNLVDLGTNVTSEIEGDNPTIVIPRSEMFPTNRARLPGSPSGPAGERPPGFLGSTNTPPGGVLPDGGPRQDRPPGPPPGTNSPLGAVREGGPPPRGGGRAADQAQDGEGRGGPPWGRGDRRPRIGRPFWMGENEYKAAIQKQGVHGFILVMSTDAMRLRCRQDAWLRGVIGVLSVGSVLGFGLAWRSLTRSSELEVRLVRAAELNARLKEMNLAAAGLAHETRNPLNIIRGLAQMISRQPEASPEVRQKSKEIIDETDRVTAQLTEFINFFRPREVRRGAVDVAAVAADVIRALGSDLEEKGLRPKVTADLPAVEADEAMLRQALFNLLLNAVQAVGAGGDIQIVVERAGPNEARIDVRDNGPGVLPEHRTEIFKPYFTTHEEGTGLGLAVVQQIVLAHGWEIVCLPNEPRGAVFRILHVRLAAGAPSGNP